MTNFDVFVDGESPAHTAINNRLQQLETAITAHGIPAGSMAAHAGSSTPSGWLPCDGAAVSRSTYAALFAAIGTTFGAGNGTTTFNVPDLRGRTPIGTGQGLGLTNRLIAQQIGEENHLLSTAELPAHTHTLMQHAGSSSIQSGSTLRDRNGSATSLGATGSGGTHNNMQPSLVTNYFIKT